ncbi:MAG: hypothetical protein JO162_14605 [Alphaproteobacteria bacterium]|nr:hypothetical protein [Alphaproteobacteria bacterium]
MQQFGSKTSEFRPIGAVFKQQSGWNRIARQCRSIAEKAMLLAASLRFFSGGGARLLFNVG